MKATYIASMAVALMSGGPAWACVALSEQMKIGYADTVVDGVAECDVGRGSCRLHARNVIKDNRPHARQSRLYRFYFEPGANARVRRESAASGEIMMCLWPWEPLSGRIEGRFYLTYEGGRLYAGQDSARGVEPGGEEEAAEGAE